jgi:hypothetical protein
VATRGGLAGDVASGIAGATENVNTRHGDSRFCSVYSAEDAAVVVNDEVEAGDRGGHVRDEEHGVHDVVPAVRSELTSTNESGPFPARR